MLIGSRDDDLWNIQGRSRPFHQITCTWYVRTQADLQAYCIVFYSAQNLNYEYNTLSVLYNTLVYCTVLYMYS